MASQTLALLKDTFIWEQQQLLAPLINKTTGFDVGQDQLKKQFADAWVKYFQKMQNSDQSVIDVCDKEAAGLVSEVEAKNTIDKIIASDDYDDVRAGIAAILNQ